MNSAIFLAIGIFLLVILLRVSGRRKSDISFRPGVASEYLVRLPPAGLLERCFSEEDAGFVGALGSRAVARLWFQERRRLALEWLRLEGTEARRLFGLHIRTARFAADLRPAVEFKLLMQAGAFLVTYEVLAALVRFYGPFRARAYARSIQGLGNVLASLGRGIAQSAARAQTPRIEAVRGA